MPYLNIDDGMDEHPKIEGLSHGAFRMHICGMLYAARRGTDGVVPHAKSKRLCDGAGDVLATELIRAGVWHDLGDGCGSRTCPEGVAGAYVIHDFLQWNHSAAWWEKRSEDQATKGSRAMHRRWHVRRGVFREDCKHCQADNNGYSHSNNKSVTEPEPEPEPEPISISHLPALTPRLPNSTQDRAREAGKTR